MGGGNSKSSEVRTTIKKKVTAEISLTIKNITENINRVSNETVNEVVTNVVQSTAADIKTSTSCSNLLKAKNIVATGSTIDINQSCDVQAENAAIIKIITDSSSMTALSQKVADGIDTKVKNDTAAKSSMDQLAALTEQQKLSGGIESMIEKITDTAQNMMSTSMAGQIMSSQNDKKITDVENDITSRIKQDILNKTVNQNDISNTIKNTVKNSMDQAAKATCNLDTTGGNSIDADNIIAAALAGQAGNINIKQSISLKAFNKCFIDLNIGNKIVEDFGIDNTFFTKVDAQNAGSSDSKVSQDAKISTETTRGMGVMEGVTNIVGTVVAGVTDVVGSLASIFKISPEMMWMIIGTAGVGLIGTIVYAMTSGGGDRDRGDDRGDDHGDDRQSGGFFNNFINMDTESSLIGMNETEINLTGGAGQNDFGNVYLWAFLAVLIYYVYGKSIPMSSLLVVVIIGYVIYKIKNKNI